MLEYRMRADTTDVDMMFERLKKEKLPELTQKIITALAHKAREFMVRRAVVHKGSYPDGSHGGAHKSSHGVWDTVPPGKIVGPSMDYSKYIFLGTKWMKARPAHMQSLIEVKNEVPNVVRGVLMEMS